MIEVVTQLNCLTPNIYQDLRAYYSVFTSFNINDVTVALANNTFDIVAFVKNKPVGMVRVVGDGKIVFLIKDMVVHPDFRALHIGDLLMKKLKIEIFKRAASQAYICLFASKGTETFYQKYDFYQRPNGKQGAGMMLLLPDLNLKEGGRNGTNK